MCCLGDQLGQSPHMAPFDVSLQCNKSTAVEGIAPKLALYGSRRIPELLKIYVPVDFWKLEV
jgi:hypothetical protein